MPRVAAHQQTLPTCIGFDYNTRECDVELEDFVHEFYLVQRFKNAYKRIIEPLPDRSQWPIVDLPYVVAAPLDKRGRGKYKKLRIKNCLEGGNSKWKK
jgi:hypothetical protein